jgi:hypothetical protein
VSKYDAYLLAYLDQYTELHIEKIGVFEKKSGAENESGWNFTCDKKAITSPELIDLVAAQTGKNKMLVTADLSSFFELSRELVNTGKAVEIPGIGFIKTTSEGTYTHIRYEDMGEVVRKPSAKTNQDVHSKKAKSGEKATGIISAFIIALILGAIGWGVYRFFQDNREQQLQKPDITNIGDSITQEQTGEYENSTVNINTGDSVVFKFVIETTTLGSRAIKRSSQLKSFGNPAGIDSTRLNGVTSYDIFISKKATAADTAAIRDSIARFFIPKNSGKKIRIKY